MSLEDLYGLMGVEPDASVQDIQRSYRKLCLKCHPDKFPDDENKANQFLKLTKVLDLLADPVQRKAYDAKLAARKLHKKRKAAQDATTRSLRDALEAREREAKRQKREGEEEQIDLNKEIQRLREEGLRKLEEEKQRREKQAAEVRKEQRKLESQIIISWENSKDSPSEAKLKSILQGYGNISSLLVSKSKAVAEFESPESAVMAINSLHEHPAYHYLVKSRASPEAMKKYELKVAEETNTKGLGPRYVGETRKTESSESRDAMFQSHLDFEAQILEQMRQFQNQQEQGQ